MNNIERVGNLGDVGENARPEDAGKRVLCKPTTPHLIATRALQPPSHAQKPRHSAGLALYGGPPEP